MTSVARHLEALGRSVSSTNHVEMYYRLQKAIAKSNRDLLRSLAR